VQDGGAVLGFSYHDLMARLKILGPDNAWQRLQEIVKWFDEVQAAGGYRKSYDGSRDGSLQGGGTPRGLGLDHEFFESALVPQVLLYGFLGFAPRADGFKLEPRLPSDWSELVVDRIRFQNVTLRVRAAGDLLEVRKEGVPAEPVFLKLPDGQWKAALLRDDGSAPKVVTLRKRERDGAVELNWGAAAGVRFELQAEMPHSKSSKRP